eukprot:4515332-Alexandrium_andersonii.AAC.1
MFRHARESHSCPVAQALASTAGCVLHTVHMHSLLCVCSSIVLRHCHGAHRTAHYYRVLANVQQFLRARANVRARLRTCARSCVRASAGSCDYAHAVRRLRACVRACA